MPTGRDRREVELEHAAQQRDLPFVEMVRAVVVAFGGGPVHRIAAIGLLTFERAAPEHQACIAIRHHHPLSRRSPANRHLAEHLLTERYPVDSAAVIDTYVGVFPAARGG
ncbi:hypothetical protein GCM10009619_40650 [Williamsia maris]